VAGALLSTFVTPGPTPTTILATTSTWTPMSLVKSLPDGRHGIVYPDMPWSPRRRSPRWHTTSPVTDRGHADRTSPQGLSVTWMAVHRTGRACPVQLHYSMYAGHRSLGWSRLAIPGSQVRVLRDGDGGAGYEPASRHRRPAG